MKRLSAKMDDLPLKWFVDGCAMALATAAAAAAAAAQGYPPAEPPDFATVPAVPRASEPFDLTFGTPALGTALGVWGTTVSDHTITVLFDYWCGFICPGGQFPYYQTYSVPMPGLPVGTYTVRFLGEHVFAFTFDVVGNPPAEAVPAADLGGCSLLLLLTWAIAWRRMASGLRRGRRALSGRYAS